MLSKLDTCTFISYKMLNQFQAPVINVPRIQNFTHPHIRTCPNKERTLTYAKCHQQSLKSKQTLTKEENSMGIKRDEKEHVFDEIGGTRTRKSSDSLQDKNGYTVKDGAALEQNNENDDDENDDEDVLDDVFAMAPRYICDNGLQTVPYTSVCDREETCDDKSDEYFCTYPVCKIDQVKCDFNQKVRQNYVTNIKCFFFYCLSITSNQGIKTFDNIEVFVQ